MICPRCSAAADRRLPRAQHCDAGGGPGTACDCQHEVDLYREPAAADTTQDEYTLTPDTTTEN